eukprot:654966-Alexandrium_andersonii.AAC.1
MLTGCCRQGWARTLQPIELWMKVSVRSEAMSVFVVALLSALASALLNPACFNMPVLAVGDPTKRICSF